VGDKLFAAKAGNRWLGKGRLFTEPVGMPREELLDAALDLGVDTIVVLSLEDAQKIPRTGQFTVAPKLLVQFAELPAPEPTRAS
jgi:hypothetical protein